MLKCVKRMIVGGARRSQRVLEPGQEWLAGGSFGDELPLGELGFELCEAVFQSVSASWRCISFGSETSIGSFTVSIRPSER